MTKNRIILVVEDLESRHRKWMDLLDDSTVTYLKACSIAEAKKLFDEHKSCLALIVMDACVPGASISTEALVRKFRETFKGPILAQSNDGVYRDRLRGAGCDHECAKDEVPKMVAKILGLQL